MLRHDQLPPIPAEPRPLPDGPLYFVGVGGAGMSSIAQVLAERGRTVAGGDPGISDTVRARLERVGVRVYKGHDASQVGSDTAVVVVSDAIPENNPEVRLAQERGLPIFRRPEVLGAIMDAGRGIAIAGTHGKTTTTGMVASILLAANLDPTIILGGDLPAIGGNARNGKGDIVLAESCEAYDGFLYLHPKIAVVLNIEADHLDYHGDEAHVIASFERFLRQVNATGTSVVCGDDQVTSELLESMHAQNQKAYVESIENSEKYPESSSLLNYGLNSSGYTYSASNISVEGTSTSFTLLREDFVVPEEDNLEDPLTGVISTKCFNMALVPSGHVTLGVPGRHNVLNAIAAAAVGFELDISQEAIIAGLEAFTGTGRRFERIGEAGEVLIVDDYAHHPTELRATLAAARSAYPDRRLVAVFQPHLPSRTRDNMDAFADALTLADAVYLTDIYLAREQPLPGVSSETLAERTRQAAASAKTTSANAADFAVVYVPDKNDLPARLAADVRWGDIVLTMGAGDIRAAGEKLFELVSLSPRPPLPASLGERGSSSSSLPPPEEAPIGFRLPLSPSEAGRGGRGERETPSADEGRGERETSSETGQEEKP